MSHINRTAIRTERPNVSGEFANLPEPLRIALGDVARPKSPPLFYRNDLGAVTNRRQFLQFYQHKLAAGQPLGPHIFARGCGTIGS